MVSAIKQTVTVQAGGRVEVRDPRLTEGTRAEVIVLLETADDPRAKLALLDALQQSMRLDRAAAEAWARQVQAERHATSIGDSE